jgi:hypothetical protein
MADNKSLENPFANAVIVEDEEEDLNPFANAVVVDDGPAVEPPPEDLDPANLPIPTTGMYDDIKTQGFLPNLFGFQQDRPNQMEAANQAQARYDAYRNSPNSTENFLTGLNYTDPDTGTTYDVPRPGSPPMVFGDLFGSDLSPDVSQMVVSSIKNAAKNGTKFAASVVDGLRDKFSPTENESALTQWVDSAMAETAVGDSFVDTMVIEGAAPLMTGGAIAKVILRGGGWLRSLVAVPASEFAFSVASDSDVGTLAVGDNAMFDMGLGFNLDPNMPDYEQEMKRRLNVFLDATAVTKTAEIGIGATVALTKAVVNATGVNLLVDMFNTEAREANVGQQVLRFLTDLDPAQSDYSEKVIELSELLEKNKEVLIELGGPGELDALTLGLDTVTAYELAVQAGDIEGAERFLQKLQTLQTAAKSRPASQTVEALAAPASALEDVTRQTEEVFAPDAVEKARLAVDARASDEALEAMEPAAAIQQRLDNLRTDIEGFIDEDVSFISRLEELNKETGFDVFGARTAAEDGIIDQLLTSSKAMDDTKNALFNDVKGGVVSGDDIFDLVAGLEPTKLDAARKSALGRTEQFSDLLDASKPREIEVPKADGSGTDTVRETAEETRERFVQYVEDNLDFGRLFTEVRPNLADTIGRLREGTGEEKATAQILIKFKDYIDNDAMDVLRESGDDEVLEAATTAMDYFKNTWAKYWDDAGPLEEVGRLRRQTENLNQDAALRTGTTNQVQGMLNETNRQFAGNMVELLNRPELNTNSDSVVSYIIGDALGTIGAKLSSTKSLTELELTDVRSALAQYGSILRDNFPEEAGRIDSFLQRIEGLKVTDVKLQNELKVATEAGEAASKEIFNTTYSAFFKDGNILPNGYDSLTKLFKGPQSIDKIATLVDSGDPVIIDGVQSAYAKWLREEKLFTSGTDTTGQRVVSVNKINKINEEIEVALQYGDKIFQDYPGFMDGIRDVMDIAKRVGERRAARNVAGSDTAEKTLAMQAVNRTVTLTMGPLSRLGARVRSAATGIVNNKLNPDFAADLTDAMMADPEEFMRVAGLAANAANRRGGIATAFTTPEERAALAKWIFRSGIYNQGDQEPTEEQINQLLLQAAQLEMQATETLGNVRDVVSDQMNELFQ